MHSNNFDFLRILFALFVIITHSYLISLGPDNETDWLGQLTNDQLKFSTLGLAGFFSISGYLIFISMQKSQSLVDYYRKRSLRILPGLLAVLVLTSISFVLLSNYSLLEYFTSSEPYRYVLLNFNLYTVPQTTILDTLKGNPFPRNINSSVWTIRYEFLFYIGISLLFFIRDKKNLLTFILLFTFILLWAAKFLIPIPILKPYALLPTSGFSPFFIAHFGLYFITGALLALIKIEHSRYPNVLLLLSVVIVICALDLQGFKYISGIFIPIIIILLGLKSTPGIAGLSNKLGDPSYGIYLYGFPIQQILMRYFHLSPVVLMLTAAPLAVIFGFLSWHLLEKKVLKFKLQPLRSKRHPAK